MTCLGRLLSLAAISGLCWFSAILGIAAVVNVDGSYLILSATFAVCAVAILVALMREEGVTL